MPRSAPRPASGVDVLLGHALFMALDPKQQAKQRPFPPLGTLYAAAGLREAGLSVALFDAMLAPDASAFDAALAEHRPRLVVLFEDSFNFLSKMCLGRMRQAALRMIRAARADGLPVLVAGSDATDAPAVYLEAGATAVMVGEADHTVVEAARRLLGAGDGRASVDLAADVARPADGHWPADAKQATNVDRAADIGPLTDRTGLTDVAGLTDVPGLALLGPDGEVCRTAPRPPERDPDVFPRPARDLVDIEAYRRIWTEAHGAFTLNMVSTRGCPFHCNWCAKPIWGQRYAMRAPEAVAEELAEVKARIGPDRVWFVDDIFGLRSDWTAAFGRRVEALDAQLPLQIQSRVDLMTAEAVDGLARAGCAEVWLGVESGSQRVLDAMEKGIRVDDVPGAVARLRERGIRACFFLQLGYPGETWDDILATAALVRQVTPDDIGVSVSYPLPGTRFYDMVARQLGDKDHWTDSRDLAMLFRGTYESDFYRRLHRLLHRELDVRHALADARAAGDDTGSLEAALDDVRDTWAALARAEPAARNADPTAVERPAAARPAPDLSRRAN